MAERDFAPGVYTNGELRALVSPVFGINHARIADLAMVLRTEDGLVGVHSMCSEDMGNAEHMEKDMRLLAYGILNILDDLRRVFDE